MQNIEEIYMEYIWNVEEWVEGWGARMDFFRFPMDLGGFLARGFAFYQI